ncbi:MAG TPA: hypothetical protein VF251_10745 [Pyrinomonadaceae bacterium]
MGTKLHEATQTNMSIQRFVINFAVALLACVIGVLGSRISRPIAPPTTTAPQPPAVCDMPGNLQPILDVHFCDLMADPERYDGQVVRIEAFMLAQSGYEPINDRVYLGQTRCTANLSVNEGFHLTSRTCPAVMQTLDSLLMRYDPVYPSKNAKVRVVGIFSSPKESTRSGKWQSERFTIISVERAASVDENN